MTLEWEVEDNSSDDFPDLVCHSAYTRGGTRITVMGLGIEGARTYSILDYTDPYDGTRQPPTAVVLPARRLDQREQRRGR